MSERETGGLAFPIITHMRNGVATSVPGMTLRDWFAGQALAESTREIWSDHKYEVVAKRAYGLADAMLKARNE